MLKGEELKNSITKERVATSIHISQHTPQKRKKSNNKENYINTCPQYEKKKKNLNIQSSDYFR